MRLSFYSFVSRNLKKEHINNSYVLPPELHNCVLLWSLGGNNLTKYEEKHIQNQHKKATNIV
jgi:hypothetical protein